MDMTITFPGGKQVAAEFGGYRLLTDQPAASGGDGVAPSPYDYFLASIGTCAGFYVLSFCQQRDIPTDGIRLTQTPGFTVAADGRRTLTAVAITISVPPEFPEKYRTALVKAAESCAVKKAILHPPEFSVVTRVEG
jgi:ribosomal protein S12 methylthiotransferase accessory factor